MRKEGKKRQKERKDRVAGYFPWRVDHVIKDLSTSSPIIINAGKLSLIIICTYTCTSSGLGNRSIKVLSKSSINIIE